MFFDGIGAWRKSVISMALVTIGRNTVLFKFFFVKIRVTVSAMIMFQGSGQTCRVTLFAINQFVLSKKFKIGFVVIE